MAAVELTTEQLHDLREGTRSILLDILKGRDFGHGVMHFDESGDIVIEDNPSLTPNEQRIVRTLAQLATAVWVTVAELDALASQALKQRSFRPYEKER